MKVNRHWTLTFGGYNRQELILALRRHGIGLNAYAETLLAEDRFTESGDWQEATLIETSVRCLGLSAGGVYSDIVDAAIENGLQLCPLEIGPYFRLQYMTQMPGPYLTIASEKTQCDDRYPNGFYLRHYDQKLWLRGYRADYDWVWEPEHRFAFMEECPERLKLK